MAVPNDEDNQRLQFEVQQLREENWFLRARNGPPSIYLSALAPSAVLSEPYEMISHPNSPQCLFDKPQIGF